MTAPVRVLESARWFSDPQGLLCVPVHGLSLADGSVCKRFHGRHHLHASQTLGPGAPGKVFGPFCGVWCVL